MTDSISATLPQLTSITTLADAARAAGWLILRITLAPSNTYNGGVVGGIQLTCTLMSSTHGPAPYGRRATLRALIGPGGEQTFLDRPMSALDARA
jgi:hypothetical protein